MSDVLIVAVIAAVPTTIIALATLWQTIRNGAKATVLTRKADEIHVLVNSNLTTVKAQLAAALAEIVILKKLVAQGKAPTRRRRA